MDYRRLLCVFGSDCWGYRISMLGILCILGNLSEDLIRKIYLVPKLRNVPNVPKVPFKLVHIKHTYELGIF